MTQYKKYTLSETGKLIDVTPHEPDPIPSSELSVQKLAVIDLQDFGQVNFEYRFDTEFQSLNGTSALVDAYEGALELVLSLRKAIYIKTGK